MRVASHVMHCVTHIMLYAQCDKPETVVCRLLMVPVMVNMP